MTVHFAGFPTWKASGKGLNWLELLPVKKMYSAGKPPYPFKAVIGYCLSSCNRDTALESSHRVYPDGAFCLPLLPMALPDDVVQNLFPTCLAS